MDTLRGHPVVGPMSLKVGVVNILPKLIVRKILEPIFNLADQVHLVCYENKEEKLLSELAVHKLDMVLSDSPVRRGFHVKAYNHLLGECGVTFLAVKTLAERFRKGFPGSLNTAPMLLPLEMTALRQWLERWFESLNIKPVNIGEFEDSALLEAFGRHGLPAGAAAPPGKRGFAGAENRSARSGRFAPLHPPWPALRECRSTAVFHNRRPPRAPGPR